MNEQLKIIISAEIGKLKQAVAEAQSEFKELTSEAQGSGGKIDAAMAKAGSAVASASKKMAVGIAALATALAGTAIATQEYRDDIAKLNTAFEAAGYTTNSAKDAYRDLYSVIGETDQAVEASQQIAMLANSEKDVAKWSELAAGVVGRFGDALQPETFYEAANETLKLGEATGAYTQMLEGCGMSVDEFNAGLAACNTEEEKQAYMLEMTNKALGEHAELFKKNNEAVIAQREAQMKLEEALAAVGSAMAPIITSFTEFGANVLSAIVPYIQQLAEEYGPTLQSVLEGIATALEKAFTWASQHQGLLTGIAAIIATVVTAIGLYNAVAAIKVAMDAAQVTSLTALIAAQLASAAAMVVAIAPYALIVAAIGTLIYAIVKIVKNWDEYSAKVKQAAADIKQYVSDMVGKVVEWFKQLGQKISTAASDIWRFVTDKFEAIKSGIKNKLDAFKTNVTNTFNAVKEAIMKPVNQAKEKVSYAVETIKSKFKFNWSLPKPSLPKFSVTGGQAPWGFGGKGSLPRIKISWNKLGGVFDNPALFTYGNSLQGLGEDGAEAVVPLEKNTKWLDKIADKIAAKQGNVPIVLEVDGKTFAQVSIDSINALTRQRGNLGLNLI